MRSDYTKLFLSVMIGALCGFILFEPIVRSLLSPSIEDTISSLISALCGALLGSIAMAVWQLINVHRLFSWLKNSRHSELASESSGVTWEIQSLLSRRSNAERKRQLLHSQFMDQVRNAVSVLPDAIIFIDQSSKIRWANANSSEMLDVTWPGDKDISLLDLVRIEGLQNLIESSQHKPSTKSQGGTSPPIKKQSDSDGIEFRVLIDEQERYLNIQSIPYAEGLTMIVARDVSRLVRANKMQTDFVANVSHELKTPLTVLKGYIEILQGLDSSTAATQLPKIAAQMEMQNVRMEIIVEDLLYLSSLEDPSTRKPDQNVNLKSLIATALETAQPRINEKSQTVSIAINSEHNLSGNPEELHSALSNLINNAISYTQVGGEITIGWNADLVNATLSVSDNGSGIARHHLPRITERFYRADADRSRESGGTGLGLAIVKHVLNRHEAHLSISSELEVGSTFNCNFPVHRLV